MVAIPYPRLSGHGGASLSGRQGHIHHSSNRITLSIPSCTSHAAEATALAPSARPRPRRPIHRAP
jgi:hypothetical protein